MRLGHVQWWRRRILERRATRLEQPADQAAAPGFLGAQDTAGSEVLADLLLDTPAHRRNALDKLGDGALVFLGLGGHGGPGPLGRGVRQSEDDCRVPVRGSLRCRTQNRDRRAGEGPSDHRLYAHG